MNARETTLRLSRFAYVWLMVGFALGTLTLLGPVRWITGSLRARGTGEGVEDIAVMVVIGLFVVGSAVLSWALARRSERAGRIGSASILVLVSLAAGGALWVWLSPGLINRGAVAEVVDGTRFTFGPYPDRDALLELKEQGYTDVISLLHPAVVPFEPKLLADEREAAKDVGINLVHAPMLPWISDNGESVELIRELARSGRGKYYVHCYLGRDRVGVVRRLVASEAGPTLADDGEGDPFPLASSKRFERGPVSHLGDSVYLTPYPTDEEFLAFYLSPGVGSVVSLMDPGKDGDRRWIEKERTALGMYGVEYHLLPVPSFPFDPQVAAGVAARVRTLPRPVVVHAFRVDTPRAQGFAAAYRSGVPALAPTLWTEPLEAGPARVVAPGVAVGPAPTGREFGAVLKRRGLRGVVFVSTGDEQPNLEALDLAELPWVRVRPDAMALRRAVQSGGPWYVYGPGLDRRLTQVLSEDPVTLAMGPGR